MSAWLIGTGFTRGRGPGYAVSMTVAGSTRLLSAVYASSSCKREVLNRCKYEQAF